MARPDKSFELPRDMQTLSRLIQLPSELRLKILRYLLKAPNPLPNRDFLERVDEVVWYRADNICRDAVRLSAQVLSVCQSLWEEGFEVLYGENVLTMCCTFVDNYQETIRVGVLSSHFFFKRHLYDVLEHARLHMYDNLKEWHSLHPVINNGPNSAWHSFQGSYEYMLGFMSNIELTVRSASPYTFQLVGCQIKPVLDGKAVTIKESAAPRHRKGECRGVFEASNLEACRVFRCSSLKIDLQSRLAEDEKKALEDIEAIAESDNDIPNLCNEWAILEELYQRDIDYSDEDMDDGMEGLFDELALTALSADVGQFEKDKAYIISRLLDAARVKIRDAEKELACAQGKLEKLRNTLLN